MGAVHSEGKGAAKDTGFGDGQRHRLDSRSSVWGQCSAEQLKACLKWTWSGETEFLAEAFSSKGLTDRAADTLGEARPTVCHLCKAALTAARSAKGRTDRETPTQLRPSGPFEGNPKQSPSEQDMLEGLSPGHRKKPQEMGREGNKGQHSSDRSQATCTGRRRPRVAEGQPSATAPVPVPCVSSGGPELPARTVEVLTPDFLHSSGLGHAVTGSSSPRTVATKEEDVRLTGKPRRAGESK